MKTALRNRANVAPLLAAMLVLVCGCFLVRSPKNNFYTLTATTVRCDRAYPHLRIGLGPISFPGYLQNSALATRVDPTRVEYSSHQRWAEPLGDQFTRLLAANMGSCLGTDQILVFPWYPNAQLDEAVRVDVLAFEVDTTGVARLKASWTVRHPHTDELRRSDSASFTEAAKATTVDARVEALSHVLARLAERIAADLRRG